MKITCPGIHALSKNVDGDLVIDFSHLPTGPSGKGAEIQLNGNGHYVQGCLLVKHSGGLIRNLKIAPTKERAEERFSSGKALMEFDHCDGLSVEDCECCSPIVLDTFANVDGCDATFTNCFFKGEEINDPPASRHIRRDMVSVN